MVECQICHIKGDEMILHEVGMVVCYQCKPQTDKALEMLEHMGLTTVHGRFPHTHATAA